jgi:membrane-associated phospholipid phosphatase
MRRRAAAVRLNKTDRLALSAITVLAAICATTEPQPALLLSVIGLIAAVVVVLALWSARSSVVNIAHDFCPLPVILAIFELMGRVVSGANPRRWDASLAGIDARWFAGVADVWQHMLGRPSWLTDGAYLAYTTFFFAPFVIAVALYRLPRREHFADYMLMLLTTFVAVWVGYLAFPAVGPRVPPALAEQVLGGSEISHAVRAMLRTLERNKLDAFPSGHAAVSLVYTGHAWVRFPRWRPLLVTVEIALLFSTVYLSFHYVIDVLCGALLAGAISGFFVLVERAHLRRSARGTPS